MLITYNGNRRPSYALLDTGANTSAITNSLCEELEIPKTFINVNLNTFDQSSNKKRAIASFKVTDLNNTFELNVENALVGELLSTENELPPTSHDLNQFEHLKNLKFNELADKSIGLLLDAKFAYYFCTGQNYIGKENEPIGWGTHFGLTIIGPRILSENSFDNEIQAADEIMSIDANTLKLTDLINRAFRADFICRENELFPQEVTHPSVDDRTSLAQLNESVVFDEEDGRWQVGMPWRLGRQPTADLFRTIDFLKMALSRHDKLGKKFELDENLKEGSFAQMDRTLEEGHAIVLDSLEAPDDSPVCYLPNLVVTKPNKPGKFRICQDAAARVGKHCLNKYLFSGPDLLNKLISVIFRFRRKRYTLSADIENFFYQIKLDPRDKACLRYLWWTDKTMRTILYLESTRHIFGITSSPTISNYILKLHAEKVKGNISEDTFWIILLDFYVDDMLSSVDTIDDARRIKNELIDALKSGGFNLTKFKSNIPELNDVPHSIPTQQNSSTKRTGTSSSSEEAVESGNSAKLGPDGLLESPKDAESSTDEEEDLEVEHDITPAELVSQYLGHQYETDCAKELKGEPTTKILGVGYCYERDVMTIQIGSKAEREIVTKQELLSFIASVYDPCGFVAPWILEGRIYFQEVSPPEIPWKSDLKPELYEPVSKWKQSIVHLKKLTIDRWTNPLGLQDALCDLVIFSDASKIGYGICCYLRKYLRGGGNQVSVSFLVGKSHVVPTKMALNPTDGAIPHCDSIPRLELVAGKLAAQWRDLLIRESGETFENIYLFSDSLTLLNWLFDFSKRFRTFENFRIEGIRALTELNEWHHVPSKQNPADLASKGIKGNDSKSWAFYHQGPEFLLSTPDQWPPKRPNAANSTVPSDFVADVSAINLLTNLGTQEEPEIELDLRKEDPWPLRVTSKMERWADKVRRVAIVRRVLLELKQRVEDKKLNLTRSRLRPKSNQPKQKLVIHLSEEDRDKAENILIKSLQNMVFERETAQLVKMGIFSPNSVKDMQLKDSKLTTLSPFLDNENIIRAGGRCAKAEYVPYGSRFPIIIPNHNHELTRSLIRHYHQKNLHTTIQQTYYLLREKYFLLGGKTAIQSVLSKCVVCQRLSKRLAKQREGDLPLERIQMVPPFYHTGLDALGPFHLKHAGRGTKKQFVLIACCMSTRAISLVPLRDMTSSSVINSLIKIHSQFPALKKLYSDNGSNFKGADREIREAVEAWNKENLNKELANLGLEWNFGPTYSGSSGGAWERLIGMVKKLLRSTIGTKNIDQHDFEALLAGASGIMNRRPLMPVSANVDDELPLTPSHFLYPYLFVNPSNYILPPHTGEPETIRHGWRCSQFLLDQFWLRFKTEYLQSLAKRDKQQATESIQVGQIVILKSEDDSREHWPLGRVVKVINSDPLHSRRLLIRLANGREVDRHINSCIILST